ncbi:uncharacterized protein LOC130731598 isoform X1 [Lotus japonicus]|uniref:uncharacterized protein LOC130731598 isoform X1 n=1 Tax=Lotus japonicus TaxID=34305 RepID=UPI002588042F|nr:uncharacterized protein LOC130731598 isoform X1 [Lotus japonicus]XP_057439861.1 uncharacterized protein LOC130731598 isoform X1 [Lotus japonicus]
MGKSFLKNLGDEKPATEEKEAAYGNKESPVNESEEKEPEDKEMTLEEYEKVLEEKRKVLQALKTQVRKVDAKEFESMQPLSHKKDNDEIFAKLGSDKDKRRDAIEKEKSKKVSNTTMKMTPLPRIATGSMSKLILHLWWLLCLRYQHGFRVKRSTAVYPASRPFPPLILTIDGNDFGYFICHLKAMRASEAASTIECRVVNPLNECHGFDAAPFSMFRVPNLDYVVLFWCSTPQHIDYGGESPPMRSMLVGFGCSKVPS